MPCRAPLRLGICSVLIPCGGITFGPAPRPRNPPETVLAQPARPTPRVWLRGRAGDPAGGPGRCAASMPLRFQRLRGRGGIHAAAHGRAVLLSPGVSFALVAPAPSVRASCRSLARHPCLENVAPQPHKNARTHVLTRTLIYTRSPDPQTSTRAPPLDPRRPLCYNPLWHSGFRPRRPGLTAQATGPRLLGLTRPACPA